MTKLDPDQTKIHLIGNNVTGNKKGESLMKFLSKTMQPSKVTVESPLELGQAGGWGFGVTLLRTTFRGMLREVTF